MSDSLGDGGFWLPSEFLTDDDDETLMDKENFNRNSSNNNTSLRSNLCFPREFPYSPGSSSSSSLFTSPVESVMGSDVEDLLAELTRSTLQETQPILCNPPKKFDKTRGLSCSPQSTLIAAAGSWTGRSSVSSNGGSPNGPSRVSLNRHDDVWDLMYAPPEGRGPLNLSSYSQSLTSVHPPPPAKNPTGGYYPNQYLSHNLSPTTHDLQCSSIWGRKPKEGLNPISQSQYNQFQHQQISQNRARFESINGRCGLQEPNRHHQNRLELHGGSGMRAVFLGGGGGGASASSVKKKECAGTGVFLPRGYGNLSDSPKKTAGCSTALLPARVVQALNKSFQDITSQPQSQPHFNATSYEYALMAQRNAILTGEGRNVWPKRAINHEVLLPQDWTY